MCARVRQSFVSSVNRFRLNVCGEKKTRASRLKVCRGLLLAVCARVSIQAQRKTTCACACVCIVALNVTFSPLPPPRNRPVSKERRPRYIIIFAIGITITRLTQLAQTPPPLLPPDDNETYKRFRSLASAPKYSPRARIPRKRTGQTCTRTTVHSYVRSHSNERRMACRSRTIK